MIDLTTYIRPDVIVEAIHYGDMIRVSACDEFNLNIETDRPDIHRLLAADPRQLDIAMNYKCISDFMRQGPVIIRPHEGLCRALANTDLPISVPEYRQPFPVLGIEWPREISGDQHPTLTLLWRPLQEAILVLTHSRRIDSFYHNHLSGLAGPATRSLDDILAETRSNLDGPEEASIKTIARMAVNLGLLLTSKGWSVSHLDENTRKKRSHKDPRVRHLANRRAQLVEFAQRPMFLRWKDLDQPEGERMATAERRQPQFRRGHWKRVAYGPGHSLHKLDWIEPYWTGGGPMPDQQASSVLLE